ncbi:ABC transporter ATP-binding protein [Pseudothermotoga thermarum]|uniref:ABC transporter related protein n=1 Tax=Pseudothermotoga thermarum DSM 5069 TaxID=688269 RepID=F7YUZ4_9THEM|nr:ATP-binding cassette domain-containing protein [Pseudothermotoga thermarum]AEH50278.1 ABC transporter related protein [Pseudothermotoga thermarum DSM 5069]
MKTYAVEMLDVHKTFYSSGVRALCGASLFVEEGTVHALLGENGAGKTTLMRILLGLERPDRGIIRVFGKDFSAKSPKDAFKMGITMVHQNVSLVDELTVLENIVVGQEPTRFFWNDKKSRHILLETMRKTGLYIDVDERVGKLSLAEKQKVEILKALYRGAKVIVLDEPTAYLSEEDSLKFYELIRKLKQSNHTIILITHNVDDVLAVADKVTVLRGGFSVLSEDVKLLTKEQLINAMVGEYEPVHIQRVSQKGPLLLKVEKLFNEKLKDVSFSIHFGEIVGLVGFTGSGQKELFETIMGLRKVSSGKIIFQDVQIENLSTSKIRKLGISYIPENRMEEGLSLKNSIFDNVIATKYEDFEKNGWLVQSECENFAKNVVNFFDVKINSLKLPAKVLSGGNLQRLVIARECYVKPKLLLAHEPTAGLDVRSSWRFYKILEELKSSNSAVMIASSDYDEMIKICDRFLFIHQGKIVGELENKNLTKKDLFTTLLNTTTKSGGKP